MQILQAVHDDPCSRIAKFAPLEHHSFRKFVSARGRLYTSEKLSISSIYSLFVFSRLVSLLPSPCLTFLLNGDLN